MWGAGAKFDLESLFPTFLWYSALGGGGHGHVGGMFDICYLRNGKILHFGWAVNLIYYVVFVGFPFS